MHEISIAEELASIVLEAAAREGLCNVTKVNITFGQMVQIVPELFVSAFTETVRNTPASDAALDIEIIPLMMMCRVCGQRFLVNENLFICQVCDSTDLDIVQGKELFIKSIEGEKPESGI